MVPLGPVVVGHHSAAFHLVEHALYHSLIELITIESILQYIKYELTFLCNVSTNPLTKADFELSTSSNV